MTARILIVDDEPRYLHLLEANLRSDGYEVISAVDGAEAVEKYSSFPVDLILMDVMMPKLDGYQTCALIKNHREFKDTPVVMLTSKDSLFDRARGKLVGADQYLTKPFSKKSLTDAVLQHTQHKGE